MLEKPEEQSNINPPEEAPTDKEKTKIEKERARRESERRLHTISDEEAKKVEGIVKGILKESRGMGMARLEKWWFGRERKEWEKEEIVEKEAQKERRGGAGLAKWVFDQLSFIGGLYWLEKPEKLKTPEGKLFSEAIEPSLRRLANEVVMIGAQEDIKNYFRGRWAMGSSNPRAVGEVWKIWQKYLDEASGGPV